MKLRASRIGGRKRRPKGKNWMTAMGVLFLVMAVIIALRNLYFVSTELSLEFYFDNYTNGQLTNEKFVIAMIIGGGFLIFWGYFKKNQEDEEDTRDEKGWRSFRL